MPSLSEMGEFVNKVGVPVALLCAIGIACWYFAPLLKEFIKSQIGLVETLKSEQPKITNILQKQAETDERHVATAERLCQSQENANKLLESIQAAVIQPKNNRRGRTN